MDELLEGTNNTCPLPTYQMIPPESDKTSSVLASVNTTLVPDVLHEWMEAQRKVGHFQISMGVMTVTSKEFLDTSDDQVDSDSDNDESYSLDEDTGEPLGLDVDLDDYVASATHTNNLRGVSADHLAKIWRISHESAVKTIETTTQHNVHTEDPMLSHNYGTNDHML